MKATITGFDAESRTVTVQFDKLPNVTTGENVFVVFTGERDNPNQYVLEYGPEKKPHKGKTTGGGMP